MKEILINSILFKLHRLDDTQQIPLVIHTHAHKQKNEHIQDWFYVSGTNGSMTPIGKYLNLIDNTSLLFYCKLEDDIRVSMRAFCKLMIWKIPPLRFHQPKYVRNCQAKTFLRWFVKLYLNWDELYGIFSHKFGTVKGRPTCSLRIGNSLDFILFWNLSLILILNLKSLVNTGSDDWFLDRYKYVIFYAGNAYIK